MQEPRFEFAVIGAGIVGLAHAYHLARAGRKVVVIERSPQAVGASIRNFGMVWPIGQPPGEMREMAMASRRHWLDVLAASGIWHARSGSLHLAYHEDELAVLDEFVRSAPALGYDAEIITPAAAKLRSPVIREDGLRGAMWSPDELCLFPRQVVAELPDYLRTLGVEFRFGRAATSIEDGRVTLGDETIKVDHAIVCTGDEFETLFPAHFAASGLVRSKLQMMRARPRRPGYAIGAHLCAGLTLGHYANFRICDSLAAVQERFAREMPDHVEWGIHLLVSQHEDGALTIGDSHEYGNAVTPFLREDIDRLILAYLDTFLPLADLEVFERWHGVYAKHPTKTYMIDDIAPGVTIATGVGGAGMTLSFGFAERVVTGLLQ